MFFIYIKNTNWILSKNQIKASKKARKRHQNHSEKKKKNVNMLVNNIKIFLKRKRKKNRQYYREHHNDLPKDKNENITEYRRNYYITRKKMKARHNYFLR